MSEKQAEALVKIFETVPKLNDFQKGRLYGYAEAMEEQNELKEKEKQNEKAESN